VEAWFEMGTYGCLQCIILNGYHVLSVKLHLHARMVELLAVKGAFPLGEIAKFEVSKVARLK
jgi:hypothetical protein